MRVKLVLAAAVLVLVSTMAVSSASAQYTGGTPPTIAPVLEPVVVVPAPPSPVIIEVGRPIQAAPRPIALTGADIAQMVFLGGVLVIGGAVLVRQGRRRVALAS